jgi:hypothetical protein
MQRCQAEKPEMRSNVKQHHSGGAVIYETIELSNLLWIVMLSEISETKRGRMICKNPSPPYLGTLREANSELHFVPHPSGRSRGGSQPVADFSWDQ